jgi:ubiquinone/menaquinone biosynthesis C-methylase UbiE
MKIKNSLQTKYDEQYSDSSEEWRRIGAIGKANNIIKLTEGLILNNVIEVGAGDGNILSILSEKKFANRLTASEISKSAIEQIKKKQIANLVDVIQTEGYTLPFKDNEFDLAICSHVVEHLEFPRALLRELKRISKFQIIEIPIDFSFSVDEKFEHYYAYGHINIYTPSLFRFLLKTEDFKIVKDKCAFYRSEVTNFQYKNNFSQRFKLKLKKTIWRTLPFLLRIKPHTYTVLTK